MDEAAAVRAHGRLHAQRERLRRADVRVERRERVPRVGRRRGILLAHLPDAVRVRHPHRFRARRNAADGIGEHPEMRYYDVADRTRNRFTGQADIVPSDAWTFSVSTGILKDDFSNSFYGLQDSTGRTFSLGADFHQPNGLGAGGSYNYERYAGLQRSHEGDSSAAQFIDPLRDWTADSTETVNYFSIYADPPRIGRNTEIRVLVRLQPRRGQLPLHDPGGQPYHDAQSAAQRVQQAAAAAHRRAAPALQPASPRRSRICTSR